MKAIGFNFAKGQLRYTVLEGTKGSPLFQNKGKLDISPDTPTTDLMNWIHSNVDTIIKRVKPDAIAARMHWKITRQDQAKNFLFPMGILNLYCYNENLPINVFGTQAMTAKKLGLPKGAKPLNECDSLIGSHPPNWDNAQRYSALAAWMILPE
ncbi:MAG: hypothetical protein HOL37_07800 [Rhodospirillaceae bacterium]|jgi:Holliday junction resolvasome RuvABC endonuclease subunit|nr:hypothetical protein [Rhodospirillaceae bacterium]MBT4220219.1 hypothetical protein [Rhodospirillaceae bacterium]MBT4464537.1 hypothetical protein [Rhodospirillaceae bacterium]MBT5014372.1 hypothetical protein [Rhodospirillaceae bacterium]MBT5309222.1 hypothetical protein [Rhodospirillaceae bacterium]